MRSRVAALALTVVVCGCSSADGPPPEPMTITERDGLCEGLQNFYECSRTVESSLLANTDVGVRRAGDTLVIGLAGGGARRMVDHGSNAETVLYTYGGYLERIRHHVVNVHFYEGSAYVLVDETTGDETRLAASPVVSPDGRRVVVASYEGVAGYAPNLLRIWRVTPGGLEVEWEVEPDEWGAEDARWTDATTIRFRKLAPCGNHQTCEVPATLRLEAGEWTVTEGPAA